MQMETHMYNILEPNLLEFIPGGNQGTYTTNPAFKAVAPGTTVVHLVNSSDISKIYEIEITVTSQGVQAANP